jgi:hypothetical protein
MGPAFIVLAAATLLSKAVLTTAQDGSEDYNLIPHVPDECNDIRIFNARGSNEPYPGRSGPMLGVICSLFESEGLSCDYEDVVYPAYISYSGQYCESANEGANAGQAQMTGYNTKCPDSRLVLLGYSQGAQVVCDIVGGGGGSVFGCEQASNPPLDRSVVPGSKSKFWPMCGDFLPSMVLIAFSCCNSLHGIPTSRCRSTLQYWSRVRL